MRAPLVSITVPVYNVEDYLERCLDSLIMQTLTNIEIICVNDGSTDRSLEILKKYQKKDSRIVIVNKKNGGLPSARNAAINVARGKYIGFVDSDDFVDKNMFKKLYKTAEKEQTEVVICGAQIFPEDPSPSDWLEAALSPQYKKYDKFEPELLFSNSATTPFLWRVFVKRDLIERYQIRLDENILLGEDKLFQTMIYTKAYGITVISDKLYHYCWYREGSMMQQGVYKSFGQKGKNHTNLVLRIADLVKEESEETKEQFIKWSVPFLYTDFIYLAEQEKVVLAKALINCWIQSGYYRFRRKLEARIVEQHCYFQTMAEKSEVISMPKVSVIVPINDNGVYVSEVLSSIYQQSLKEIEVIIVNSGTQDVVYSILQKNLYLDSRIRLCNMKKSAYSEVLNTGINLAAGEYILFVEDSGWFKNNEALHKWYDMASVLQADLCASVVSVAGGKAFGEENYKASNYSEKAELEYINCDFHNVLYKTDFLRESNLIFKECSFFTGMIFLLESTLAAHSKYYIDEEMYIQRIIHRPDWISTKKCENILEAFVEIMETAHEKKAADIQARVLSILNNDLYKKIIINNTRCYAMEEWQCPNGENSQIKSVKALYKIMQAIDSELLEEAGYDLSKSYVTILCELMKERHIFLADISQKYYEQA
ncbi:MAG: glycosyltransferase [Lachnospiraceae bacterium]|nr:glycosyltransferase [Lachnospiraceae bacterium]